MTAIRVTIQKPTAKGRNVRARGIDFRAGQLLLRKGTRLSDRDLMLAAAMNYPSLRCTARPRWLCSEPATNWCRLAASPVPAKSSIRTALPLRHWRAARVPTVLDLGIARDRIEDITAGVRRAREWGADVLSPPAAPRLANMIWCSGRWRLKVSIFRSGGWPFGPADR